MSGFFPLASGLGGIAIGMLVNLISNELSFRRGLIQGACAQARKEGGALWFSLVFWQSGGCGRNWRVRHLFVLLIYSAFFAALGWWNGPVKLPLVMTTCLVVYMGVITVLDLEYKVILFPTVWLGAAIGLVGGVLLHGVADTLFGGLAGFVSMYLLYILGASLVNFMAKRRGEEISEVALGFGDVNLAGILGLWLGWPGILAGLYFAVLAGGIGSLAFVVVKSLRGGYSPYTAIPYGPFLVMAMAWFLIFRPALMGN
ncbi:MAG: prepilin peptidase [Chloroflexi bacterium]|nr:prepilin peptidase [Chloroflexota bacterium]